MGRRGGACAELLFDGCESCFEWVEVLRFANWRDQVQGDVLVLYVYQLKTDPKGVETVGVEKVSFRKNTGLAA